MSRIQPIRTWISIPLYDQAIRVRRLDFETQDEYLHGWRLLRVNEP